MRGAVRLEFEGVLVLCVLFADKLDMGDMIVSKAQEDSDSQGERTQKFHL